MEISIVCGPPLAVEDPENKQLASTHPGDCNVQSDELLILRAIVKTIKESYLRQNKEEKSV
jgi:hypothetical protein